ncbi:MAG: hypothetical protein NTW25_04280 [Candidatus Kapabacteria bacterium]|nr:hypothetical protein [Candidatus Kapabacteria bacterium]
MAQPNYINWESKIIAKDYNEKQIYFNKLLHTSDGSVFSSLCNAKNNFTLAKFSLNGNLIWYYKRSDKFIDSNFIERLNSNNIVLKEFEKDYYTLITTKYLSSPTSYGDLIQNFTINATGKNAVELIVDKKDMIETSIYFYLFIK